KKRLSHLGLIERRLAGIENDKVVAWIAHFLEHEARVLGQQIMGAERKIILVDIVDLTGLQRQQAGGRIGNNLDNDAVEIGLFRGPVVRVAAKREVVAAHPLQQLEWPLANRRDVRRRVLQHVVPRKMCAGRMAAFCSHASENRNGPNACDRRMTTVCGSGVSMSLIALPGATNFEPYLELTCNSVNLTSSDVTGWPSLQFAVTR